MELILEFALRYPVLVDPATGFPVSWRGFVVGMQLLGRMHARDALRTASAMSVAQSSDQLGRLSWFSTQRQAAGW